MDTDEDNLSHVNNSQQICVSVDNTIMGWLVDHIAQTEWFYI